MSCCGARTVIADPNNPIKLGESVDPTVYRVRPTINFASMSAGDIYWVTGSQVLELIDVKVLVLVD